MRTGQTCRRRSIRDRGGYSLVEVVVAMLLTAIIVTSVFSVALTSKGGGGKAERKLKAASGANLVAALLQNYVTADSASTQIPGPGTGVNSWSLDSPPFEDLSCVNCYALAPGEHTIVGVMGAFESPPYNAKVRYTVSNDAAPAVSIRVEWDEP